MANQDNNQIFLPHSSGLTLPQNCNKHAYNKKCEKSPNVFGFFFLFKRRCISLKLLKHRTPKGSTHRSFLCLFFKQVNISFLEQKT